jgi:predicted transglutaminase-like cysteine proteinase
LGEVLVFQGHLSPETLKSVLKDQRHNRKPLGQLLLDQGLVLRRHIWQALATQMALRVLALIVTCLVGYSSLNLRDAWASSVKDIPARLVMASTSTASLGSYPALFGMGERRSADLSAFTKWSGMFSKFQNDINSATGQKLLVQWHDKLKALEGQSLDRMVVGVNDMVNDVRYITDNRNWGRSDYWATPVEFFARGGDCEDFAIAKYTFLRMLGVSEDRMRLAIVKDLQKNIPHAILIVYTDNGPVLLDNQIKSVKATSSVRHYKPIYSINRTSWWLHTAPRATQVASR